MKENCNPNVIDFIGIFMHSHFKRKVRPNTINAIYYVTNYIYYHVITSLKLFLLIELGFNCVSCTFMQGKKYTLEWDKSFTKLTKTSVFI